MILVTSTRLRIFDHLSSDFIDAMDVLLKRRAQLIIDCIGLPKRGRLLDLGGGPGRYAMEFKKNCPQLEVFIFDLSLDCT